MNSEVFPFIMITVAYILEDWQKYMTVIKNKRAKEKVNQRMIREQQGCPRIKFI